MEFYYRARLHKFYPCGSKKFLEYYFKHRNRRSARKKVQERYPKWTLRSLRSVGRVHASC